MFDDLIILVVNICVTLHQFVDTDLKRMQCEIL